MHGRLTCVRSLCRLLQTDYCQLLLTRTGRWWPARLHVLRLAIVSHGPARCRESGGPVHTPDTPSAPGRLARTTSETESSKICVVFSGVSWCQFPPMRSFFVSFVVNLFLLLTCHCTNVRTLWSRCRHRTQHPLSLIHI